MCELFCFNSNTSKEVNECLECFYTHSEQHPHGWGLAAMQSDKFIVSKEPLKASCSEYLKDILSHPIVGKNVFAHIRLATMGEIIPSNCHPFVKTDNYNRTWMLIHNGTIFNYPPLDKYMEKEIGDTDSERILLYIIDKINEFESSKGSPSTIKERFNLISEIITDLSENNKLNIMIFDGDLTYVHTNMKESLYYLKNNDEYLIASTPVNNDENWKEVEINKIYGLIDGNVIFESEKHCHEFVFTEYHEKLIKEFLKTSDLANAYENLAKK